MVGDVGKLISKERLRPKIAILTNYPADHVTFTGGVETASTALLEGLRSYQHEFEFHIISVSGLSTGDIHEQRDGFWFHFLGAPAWLRPRLPVRLSKAFCTLLRIGPDLTHCQGNMILALATVLSGYPSLYTIHGVLADEAKLRTGWEFWSANIDALIERIVFRRFDVFICISSYASQIAGDRLKFCIPNAVRSLFFQQSFHPESAARPMLLFVGALAPLKRPLDLIYAHCELSREIPELETVLCGNVEDRGYFNTICDFVDKEGVLGVQFLEQVSQERVADLLNQAKVLVLPSEQENSPMVIAEAMAAGVPVIATRVGGVPDLVRHGETGFLYEPGDIHGLTYHLRQLLVEPTLRDAMGIKANRFAEHTFSPGLVSEATVTVYRELLHLKAPQRRRHPES